MSERGFTNHVRVVDRFGIENSKHHPTELGVGGDTAHQKFVADVWEIMDELGNLLISKQLDYGPGNINNAHGGPINGLMVRIGDKFERLKNLLKLQQIRPQHEPIEDSFKDLANYGVIGLMVKRGLWPKS